MAVLRDLAEHDGVPRIEPITDLRYWWRYGQESFVAVRPDAWHMPERATVVGWLDTFAEMAVVRAAVNADPVLCNRVDTMVGTEFSVRQRPLDALLLQHLLEPVVVASRAYAFDRVTFDASLGRLEAGLRSDTVRFVEFVPLNGLISTRTDVNLLGGVVLRPMTDRQIGRAIHVAAVPSDFSGNPTSVQVSRFHQWAVTHERCYPVCSYKDGLPWHPQDPSFPSLEEPARRLVIALRIVCGGSVVATRPIHAQHDEDFPPTVDGAAVLVPVVGASDCDRPTLLLTEEQVADVTRVYALLATTAVEQDVSLQLAVRRFVSAGSYNLPADRLIDLVICCEALFLKRYGVGGKRKGPPAAEKAAQLLGGDPEVGVGAGEVQRFVADAYRLRNAQVHGDPPARESMTLLRGGTTEDLARFVEDLGLLVGRAIHRALNELANPLGPIGTRP